MAKVSLNIRLACKPLGSTGITLLHSYYGLIQLPICYLRLLAVFGLVAAYRLGTDRRSQVPLLSL